MRIAIAVLVGAMLMAPSAGGQAPEPRTNLADIEDEVMCPVCGTTLELAESAPQAERQRELIRRLIADGLGKDEVKDVLVDEYGEAVLATPASDGFDRLAWILPLLGLGIAGTALALFVVRSRSRDPGAPEEALTPDEAARLERDLSSYDD